MLKRKWVPHQVILIGELVGQIRIGKTAWWRLCENGGGPNMGPVEKTDLKCWTCLSGKIWK